MVEERQIELKLRPLGFDQLKPCLPSLVNYLRSTIFSSCNGIEKLHLTEANSFVTKLKLN